MRRKIFFVLVLAFGLLSGDALSDGFRASFRGTPTDLCGQQFVRKSTVACYDGSRDTAGNLLDHTENLMPYSEDFTTGWTGTRATASANQVKAPDGTLTADLLSEDGTAANTHFVYLNVNVTAGQTYAFSVYGKASNRTWMSVHDNQTSAYQYVNLSDCSPGTTSGAIDSDVVDAGAGWCRAWVKWTASATQLVSMVVYIGEADNDKTFDGLSQGSIYLWGAQVVDVTDGVIKAPGPYIYTDANDKPRLDATDSATIYNQSGSLLRSDGNGLSGPVFDDSAYFSVAHDAVMNLFDSDHHIVLIHATDPGTDSADCYFSHGAYNASGMYYQPDASNINAKYGKASATQALQYAATDTKDGFPHIVQISRSSNTGTLYYDGQASTSADLTGYGIDASLTWYIGRYNSASLEAEGQLYYLRIDRDDLTTDQIAVERDRLAGLYAGADTGEATISTSTVSTQTVGGKVYRVADYQARVADGLLIEGASTNLATYSEQADQWTAARCTVSTNTIAAPDGTTTADTIAEDATAANTHLIYQSVNVTSGTSYVFSAWMRATANRTWGMLYETQKTASVYFDLANCRIGTVGVNADDSGIECYKDGWVRGWMVYTANATAANSFRVYLAEADNDATFDGLSQDSIYVWGAQVEAGYYPTSYIETPSSSAVTRNADSIAFDPIAGSTTKIDFTVDNTPTHNGTGTVSAYGQGASYTVVGGSYTDDYWDLDPTPDAMRIDGSTAAADGFDPSKHGDDFTACVYWETHDVTGTFGLFSKYNDNGNTRSYTLYQRDNDLKSAISRDGTWNNGVTSDDQEISNQVSVNTKYLTCLVYDYDTDGTSDMCIYQAEIGGTVYSDCDYNVVGPIYSTASADVQIGDYDAGSNRGFNGYFYFAAYWQSALPKATVLAMLAGTTMAWETSPYYYEDFHDSVGSTNPSEFPYVSTTQSTYLPLKIGSAEPASALTIEFEAKCSWAAASDLGENKTLFEISGSTGTASTTRNLVEAYVTSAGVFHFWLRDDADADHYCYSGADPVAFNEWHTFKVYFDMADLSNMACTIDGSSSGFTYSGNSGTADFDPTDTTIYPGQYVNGAGASNADCKIRDMRILPRSF